MKNKNKILAKKILIVLGLILLGFGIWFVAYTSGFNAGQENYYHIAKDFLSAHQGWCVAGENLVN